MKSFQSLPNACTLWESMKWAEGLLESEKRPDAALDAKWLLRYVLNYNETQLLLNRQSILKAEDAKRYEALVTQRAQGIPLQHLTHEQEFMGLSFYVNEHVLIPRQDTETLIEALVTMSKEKKLTSGIDIGTGSGCIGISLAHYIPTLQMTLIDVSKEALKVATKNVETYDLVNRITLLESDLLTAYQGGQVDLIVSNPPYIALKDMEELMIEVKEYEPHLALTDYGDGLYFYREISKRAKDYLNPDGIIAYEIGYDQGEAVMQILRDEGYTQIALYQDLAGKDRVVIGRKA